MMPESPEICTPTHPPTTACLASPLTHARKQDLCKCNNQEVSMMKSARPWGDVWAASLEHLPSPGQELRFC